MSVSVFNPVRLTEFHRMKFPEVKMHHGNRATPSLDRVRRDLFGPVDREECSRFAEQELAKHQLAASQRWGFDFVRGQPLSDTKLFLWERVPPTNDIPEMYTLSRAAHVRTNPNDNLLKSPCSRNRRHYRTSSYIDLLDERAEQSNKSTDNLRDLSFEDVDGHSATSSCDESSFEDSTHHAHDHHLHHHEKMLIDSIGTTAESSASSLCTTITRSCTTTSNSQSTKETNNHSSSNSIRCSPRNREKRQPKITDYLKQRKRLQPTPKKVSPKKARTSSNNNNISTYLLRH